MELVNFIHHNNDWKEKLQLSPYCLHISEDEHYILLKYNQLESDMRNPVVRECRGIILRKSDLSVCCRAFDKFFNAHEENAARIDWSNAVVLEKVDGSIMKVWFDDGKWNVSTNGTIDAYLAGVESDLSPVKTFGDLFDLALNQMFGTNGKQMFFEKLEIGYTYIFELVSPYNRIIVSYRQPEIYFIGVRNMLTNKEIFPWEHPLCEHVKTPKKYKLDNIEACLAEADKMGYDNEGFVVVDKDFNRIKIKSPLYVAAHYLKNNGVQTIGRLLKIVLKGEQDEFCGYFPEFKHDIERITEACNQLISTLDQSKNTLKELNFETRKDFALHVKANCKSPDFHFWTHDNDWASAEKWFNQLPDNKQERVIKEYLIT